MKKYLLIICLLISSVGFSQEVGVIEKAKDWLSIVDRGEYSESWDNSDPYFQTQLTANKWQQALQATRLPLGKMISRAESGSTFYSSLAGVPDGEYVVILFNTVFENKKSTIETVTLSKSSGHWRAVGYFIK